MTGERMSGAEELFVRWLAEHRGASEDAIEELYRTHPAQASELRAFHDEWQRVRRWLKRAGVGLADEQGHSFAERLKQEYGSGVDPAIALEKEREEGGPPTSALLRRLGEHGLRRSRYALKGELARGGMGAILKVWDEDLRRSLAMKVILGKTEGTSETPPVDRRLLARFLEEAQVTGQLDHPGIVPVHELGLDAEGRVYFTMKLVKGRDLRAIFELVFAEQEGWNETRALGVLLKVCEAMAYAHAKGVIHRDLKPANVMVGGFGEVYVMDWGLARVLGRADQHDLRLREAETPLTSVKTERREEREEAPDSPLFTMDGDVVGTPAYMPPEQALGAVERLSPRSDVYAIGAMLYHLLARHMPYVPPGGRMTNRMVLAAVTQGPPAPLATQRRDAPAELVAIVERAMAREPERRYRDTLELAGDLRAYLEHRVVSAYETGAWAETKKWVQRNKGLAASLAAAVLLLIVGLTASLVFKARADERAADLLVANTTIQQREAVAQKARAEADERTREARESLYVAAVTGAQSARRLNEPANVRRLLDSAPEELRNWEWHYLDAVSDTSLLTLEGGNSASFSPDGSRIVTASQDGTMRVWDAVSCKELARLEGHTGWVYSARFSTDGARIVSASFDKTARVWDSTSGKELARLEGHTGAVTLASFSPDGSRIVSASPESSDGTARVWDATSGKELLRLRTGYSVLFSPDGARIASVLRDQTVLVWDATSGEELTKLKGDRGLGLLSFSPDGLRIVTRSEGGTARVFDSASGKELARLEGHSNVVSLASFSSDGLRIVSASSDGTARVWDAISGKELVRLEGHSNVVWLASFSSDGLRIVSASLDGTARVWDASSGKEFARLEGHTESITSASFSPDGSRILTASRDNTARIWDAP